MKFLKNTLLFYILFVSISISAQDLVFLSYYYTRSASGTICAETGVQNDNNVLGQLDISISYQNDGGGANGGTFSHNITLPMGYKFPNWVYVRDNNFPGTPTITRYSARSGRLSSQDLPYGYTGGTITFRVDIVETTNPNNYCLTNWNFTSGRSRVGSNMGGQGRQCGPVVTQFSTSSACNFCDAGDTAPNLSSSSITVSCPSGTANLNQITASSAPNGAVLTWHTGTPASNSNKISGTAVSPGTYYAAYYSASDNCYSQDRVDGDETTQVTVNARQCDIDLNLKVYLQGAYMQKGSAATRMSDGLMRADLRIGNLIPNREPYSGLGFNQVSSGNEQISGSALSLSGSDAIVDWVHVEIRSATSPTQVVRTLNLLVNRNGDIVAPDGVSTPTLPSSFVNNSYHIAIRHRNHLGVMTQNPIQMVSTGVTFDFSSKSNQFYSKSMTIGGQSVSFSGMAQADMGDKYAMWAGNTNGDGKVKFKGADNDSGTIIDRVAKFQTLASMLMSYGNGRGYYPGDLNMDGIIMYRGTLNDTNILEQLVTSYSMNANGLVGYDFFIEQLP